MMYPTHFGTTLAVFGTVLLGTACFESKNSEPINLIADDAAVDPGDGGGDASTRACAADDDCVLVSTGCCGCGPTLDNTTAERRGFEEPPNCEGVLCGSCPEPLGPQPVIEPYCASGECKARAVDPPSLQNECKVDADCQLVASCCSCTAVPASVRPLACGAACETDVCEQHEIDRASCIAGQCMTARVLSCRADQATCDSLPPTCGALELPVIKDQCFSGDCAEKAYCAEVSSCADCQAGTLCMTQVHDGDTGETFHCMPIPPACEEGKVDCACAGQLCGAGGFTECTTTEDGIRCAP